jgi:hypothetical protein
MEVVRRLLLAEPEPDALLPHAAVQALTDLIGCDGFGWCETDETGYMLRHYDLPADPTDGDLQVCDGPLPTGIRHLALLRHRNEDDHVYPGDTLWSGFAVGGGRVRQVYFDRQVTSRRFGPRDVALLTMVEPAIGRLMRAAPAGGSTSVLTPADH